MHMQLSQMGEKFNGVPRNESAASRLVRPREGEKARTCREQSCSSYTELHRARFADIAQICRALRTDRGKMKLFTIRKLFFALFRRRRMRHFYAIFRPSTQIRLLDIGGDPYTWTVDSRACEPVPVTLVNLRFPNPAAFNDSRFTAVEGDATDLPFGNQSFDIAYSNSVIEHLTTWERQRSFASEARRVARNLWIQTPARHFPIEPHLLTPFFQYIPRRLQLRLARHFTLWGLLSKPNAAEIDKLISEVRLLTLREMKQLFPDCLILKERVLGLTKSYIAVRHSQGAG
jgi:hypothetical protein